MTVRLLPSGPDAILVECGSQAEVLALHEALAAEPPAGLVELVPAARTVLVSVDHRVLPLETAASWVRRATQRSPADGAPAGPSSATVHPERVAPVVLDVSYNGKDLDDTAQLLGIGPAELVARHLAAEWRVAFIGFAPGFAYLVSDDWPYRVPRLDAPRTRVPAGSLALADGYTGAYPRESPGGWRLIGRTEAVLWDERAEPPARLAPGARVRLREVGSSFGADS
ncbi:5-oxoprolinase subunit B family protein [Agromyces mediolanus]|uniref:5-oxoprolinase subunit B family protein n=1 Tax=Agromyces mediolanus TaxID=41986 RepID=UPI001E59F709|nr:allophanate hydrolase subunit 1 [Agromyces mediolanus]MCD1570923.1 allophanate hydrolase subunit 1 [Agromyces mediolanus]